MKIEIDGEAKALYLRLRSGRVADTVDLTSMVFMDVDKQQTPLGIEFLGLDAFSSFMNQPQHIVQIPPRMTYKSLDRQKEWEVETGFDTANGTGVNENARLIVQFISEIFKNPSAIDAIPDHATVILIPGDRDPTAAQIELAQRRSKENREVILHPLPAPAPALSKG